MMVTTAICDSADCARPGCSPTSGCQGHAARELAPDYIAAQAKQLIEDALRLGVVVTIDLVPSMPPAMGYYRMVPSVRPARERA